MDLSLWIVFLITNIVTTLSPGPNTLLVMNHSVRYGMRAGLVTIWANLTSQFFFMILVIYGFGNYLSQTPTLYFIIKTAGAIYLIYLGIRLFLSAGKTQALTVVSKPSDRRSLAKYRFGEAFLVSSSNPKTVIFLSASLPQFLDLNESLLLQCATMYVTNAIVILTIHSLYAYAAIAVKGKIISLNIRKRIAQITGATFASLGIGLLLSRKPI